MEVIQRKSINSELSKFDYLAKDDDFIEVTNWANLEGWDITINDKHFSLRDGELAAINYLTKTLEYDR